MNLIKHLIKHHCTVHTQSEYVYHCICPKYQCICPKYHCICPKYHCIGPKYPFICPKYPVFTQNTTGFAQNPTVFATEKNCIFPKFHCIFPKLNSRSSALIALALLIIKASAPFPPNLQDIVNPKALELKS